MKLCGDCRYIDGMTNDWPLGPRCLHPSSMIEAMDYVSGGPPAMIRMPCKYARSSDGVPKQFCGPDATFWEPRT
jgi:hypothetical protein